MRPRGTAVSTEGGDVIMMLNPLADRKHGKVRDGARRCQLGGLGYDAAHVTVD